MMTLEDTDQAAIDRAAALVAVGNSDEAAAWTLANVPGMTEKEIVYRRNFGALYAGMFGSAQSALEGLIGIIERQRREIRQLREKCDTLTATGAAEIAAEILTHVPMACTACGKPVHELTPGQWAHGDLDDAADCPVPAGTPVKARIDA